MLHTGYGKCRYSLSLSLLLSLSPHIIYINYVLYYYYIITYILIQWFLFRRHLITLGIPPFYPPFLKKKKKPKTCYIRSILILKVVLCESFSSVAWSSFSSVVFLWSQLSAQWDQPIAGVTVGSLHVLLLIISILNHLMFNICKESTYTLFPFWYLLFGRQM